MQLTIVCIVHFDPGACALPQLRYGLTTSPYQSTHMNHRDEQPVANLYVWLSRHVLHLQQAGDIVKLKGLLAAGLDKVVMFTNSLGQKLTRLVHSLSCCLTGLH